MSLFTRSFRRETKHLLQYRPSILGPSWETFKINFKSFLYTFTSPQYHLFFFFFFMQLPWPGNSGRGGVGLGRVGGRLVVDLLSLLQLRTPAQLPASTPAPDALSLPAVWQTFPFIRFIWKGKSARGFRMTMLIRNQSINNSSTWMY